MLFVQCAPFVIFVTRAVPVFYQPEAGMLDKHYGGLNRVFCSYPQVLQPPILMILVTKPDFPLSSITVRRTV